MLFLTILCGIGAAVLRGFQLTGSFHPQTSLIEPRDPLTFGLILLSAVFAAAAAAYSYVLRRKTLPGRPLGFIWKLTAFTALAALLSASGYDLYEGFSGPEIRWGVVCLGGLGIFSCGALLMICLNIKELPFTSATGFWATVPVFWACLVLIADFWGQMGNPVRNTYVYGLLATVCCTLALYAIAGFFFDRGKPARVALFALPGIFFAVLTAGGFLFARWLGDPAVWISMPATLRLLFIALHLTAMMTAVLYGRFTPPEKAAENTAPEEEEPPEIEDFSIEEEGA